MNIEHIAIWTSDLERIKKFYIHYFGMKCSEQYFNQATRFSSYFLYFEGSKTRIELMHRPDIEKNTILGHDPIGLSHFAIALESKEKVNILTENLRADGYKVLSEPRTTGDGYYESVIEDCEGNRVEVTVDHVIISIEEVERMELLLVDDELAFKPGSKFMYSNSGMLILGVIIEKVSGKSYFDYLDEFIFTPAGMHNTSGFYKDRPVDNRATGYTKIYENDEVTFENYQFTRIMRGSPSGGIYSTVEDFLKFDIALRTNRLLSDENTKFLFQGRPELNAGFHSYGFFIEAGDAGKIATHKGDGSGVNAQFNMYLDNGYTFVVLSNYSSPSAKILADIISGLINKIEL
jgi:lactoylglutathione lyase